MAKQTGTIRFTGKLGDVTGYQRKGKHLLRTLPRKVNQTAATKTAATKFGVISRMGKLVRQAIVPQLGLRYDGTLVNRVNRALVLGEKTSPTVHMGMQNLLHFSFNPFTSLRQILTKPAVIMEDGTVEVPEQLLHLMHKATHVEIRAVAVRIDFGQRRVVGTDEQSEVVELQHEMSPGESGRYYQPFRGCSLRVSAPGKGTLFVVLQLRACTMENGKLSAFGDRRFMAADIIAVVPQVVSNEVKGKEQLPKVNGRAEKRRMAAEVPEMLYDAFPVVRHAPMLPLLE